MTFLQWKEAVGSFGKWDYKNNDTLKGLFDSKLLDEFGNVHFGIVAHAYGFNLETSMYGAGVYQVLRQGGGNAIELRFATRVMWRTAGGYLLPDALTRLITTWGFGWGDNPGDSLNIMKGWDYAHTGP